MEIKKNVTEPKKSNKPAQSSLWYVSLQKQCTMLQNDITQSQVVSKQQAAQLTSQMEDL